MSGTIAWSSEPLPNWPSVEWRHTLKGSRLKPGVVAHAIRGTDGRWRAEINGHIIDAADPCSMRSAMTAVERVLIRKGWLAANGRWTPQLEVSS